jgi:hypothetical protein
MTLSESKYWRRLRFVVRATELDNAYGFGNNRRKSIQLPACRAKKVSDCPIK